MTMRAAIAVLLAAALATGRTPFGYYSAVTGVVFEVVAPATVEGGESGDEESQIENE